MSRNGTNPRAELPDADPDDAQPRRKRPTDPIVRLARASGVLGPALKLLAVVLLAGASSVATAWRVMDSTATTAEVRGAQRAAEGEARVLVEQHALGRSHVEAHQRDERHEERLAALERELDWQAVAISAIAQKLRVDLPARPARRP